MAAISLFCVVTAGTVLWWRNSLRLGWDSSNLWRASTELVGQMLEPLPAGNFIRIRWRCTCGDIVWDDYPAGIETEARALERWLRTRCQEVGNVAGPGNRHPIGFHYKITTLASSLWSIIMNAHNHLPGGGQFGSPDTEAQPTSSAIRESEKTSRYLTCLPSASDQRPTLIQILDSDVRGDMDYFRILRTQAMHCRKSWIRRTVPRKVKKIVYVRVCSRKVLLIPVLMT